MKKKQTHHIKAHGNTPLAASASFASAVVSDDVTLMVSLAVGTLERAGAAGAVDMGARCVCVLGLDSALLASAACGCYEFNTLSCSSTGNMIHLGMHGLGICVLARRASLPRKVTSRRGVNCIISHRVVEELGKVDEPLVTARPALHTVIRYCAHILPHF